MAIDIGPGAINRTGSSYHGGYTVLQRGNPANASGVLSSFDVWAYEELVGFKMGTFYGSATSWTGRDYETIGAVASGSKQTFTGLNCNVSANDILGCYFTSGAIEHANYGGSGIRKIELDSFGAGTKSYTTVSSQVDSLYATGISAAAVTTNSPTSIAATSLTANGNITDTGGSGSDVTRRGFCYMEGDSGDPTTENSTVYDDGTFGTGSFSKSITGLSPSTDYRLRAFAVNAVGTAYGTTVDATTDASGTLYLTAIMSHKFIPPFLGGLN